MKLPAKIFFESKYVASLESFSYDFPWAYGSVRFIDEQLFFKACAVTIISDFDLELENRNLSDSEEEKIMNEKLAEFGISYDDFNISEDGKWQLQTLGNTKQPMRAVRFDKKGFMEWRI